MRYIRIDSGRGASRNSVTASDPLAPWRDFQLVDPPNALAAGTVAGGADSAFENLANHEFGTIFQGTVSFEGASGPRVEFGAGDSFVLPAGLSGRLVASPDMRRSFLMCGRDVDGSSATNAVAVDLDANRSPCPGPSRELLLTPAPVTLAAESYRSPNGVFQAGVWQCGAFDRRPALARNYELMQIVEGEAALQNDECAEEAFLQGQSVLVHPGVRYVLRAKATFAKVYATVTVATPG